MRIVLMLVVLLVLATAAVFADQAPVTKYEVEYRWFAGEPNVVAVNPSPIGYWQIPATFWRLASPSTGSESSDPGCPICYPTKQNSNAAEAAPQTDSSRSGESAGASG